ncbi:predicted protein [Nematostella vectensis]|uniref:Pyridoxal-dependent decarboxylase domain-containing protein 1 n=1 Tax=Nematostella vectensis TaxID=45351 RepID=A7T539_NEMVE|nr:predicted protein [Nematostella vectensis]|eukprot:XP_001621025.1 hypothetical protein NEMVEDRAFT_v1g222446 [Nematostella vectensis]
MIQAQPHCTSLAVVFHYRASPSSSHSQSSGSPEGSGDDDDQDDVDLSTNSSDSGEVPPHVQDAMNRRLAEQLAVAEPSVAIEVIDIPKEGQCLRFSPLSTARVMGTTSDHIDNFVACLKEQVIFMDNILLAQLAVRSSLEGKEHVVITEADGPSTVASLMCFPQYWQEKNVEKLTGAKKMELQNLNKEVLAKVMETHPEVFTEGVTQTGLLCINFNKVGSTSEVSELVGFLCTTAEELSDSSKFLEQMTEMVQKGIEAAQKDLVKESENRLIEEGVLRQVPIVSSLVNWWSPPPKDSIQGRTFNLSSGHLDTTEKTYKYRMQVQDEDADGSFTASTPNSKNPPNNSPPKTTSTPTDANS